MGKGSTVFSSLNKLATRQLAICLLIYFLIKKGKKLFISESNFYLNAKKCEKSSKPKSIQYLKIVSEKSYAWNIYVVQRTLIKYK